MKKVILLIIVVFALSSKPHDSISATFNVIERGHVMLLEIDFDEENFTKFADVNSLKITKSDFSTYLNKTTSWEFDGEVITPQILSIQKQQEHTRVICFLSKSKKNIKKVKVKNEFFIDVDNHSNIIKLDINDSFRDFRLHKKRKELEVIY